MGRLPIRRRLAPQHIRAYPVTEPAGQRADEYAAEGEKETQPLDLDQDDGQLRERIRSAVSSQTQTTVTVLSCLLAVQDEIGYLPDEALEEVASRMDTTLNEVWGVASFYTNFRFTPPGDRVVEVCWGPTCHLLGAPHILKAIMEELGLDDEGETEGNRTSLKYNTCLGACSQAPVLMVDHKLVGRLTVDKALARVSEARDGA